MNALEQMERYPNIDWVQPLPGVELPSGILLPAQSMVDEFWQKLEDGFAAPHDPILHREMPEIPEDEIDSHRTREVVEIMQPIIEAEQIRTKGTVAGLAANQKGIPARIAAFALNLKDSQDTNREMTYLANPEIVWLPNKETGAYTRIKIPHMCVGSTIDTATNIDDHDTIELSGWDVTPGRKPKYVRIEREAYAAGVGAHEKRHLDGITSIKYALDNYYPAGASFDPQGRVNWRPEELKKEFKTAFNEQDFAVNWLLKPSRNMLRGINNGNYLRMFIANLDEKVKIHG
jgi:peptide deformylase